jgi:hypothetical protein
MSSLGLLLDLIIDFIIIFTIIISVEVPSPMIFHIGKRKRRVDCVLGGLKTHSSAYFALTLLQVRKHLAHLLMRLTDKGIIGAAHRDESLEALDKNVLLLAPTSGNSGGLKSSSRCMRTSRRNTCTGRRSSRGTMGCSRGTHSSNGWRRRRNGRSPDNVRLISSMLAIIPKFHLSLEVNDPLDVGFIEHILRPMV